MLRIFLVCFLVASQAHATLSDQIAALLNLQHRPSIKEFREILKPLPARNPFKPLISDDYYEKSLKEHAAEFIIEIEHAYPGATWALLGRDSSLAADILEAFYLKNGHEERVIRLNASGQSFRRESDYLALLQSAGLVENNLPIKKFVLLDATRWQPESQLRTLLESLYHLFPQPMRAAYQPFVNAINILPNNPSFHSNAGTDFSHGPQISPALNMVKFWTSNLPLRTIVAPIVRTERGFSYLPMVVKAEIAWHEKFNFFSFDTDGRITAMPGPLKSIQMREHILWWMYQVVKTIDGSKFQEKIKRLSEQVYHVDLEKHFYWGTLSFNDNVKELIKSSLCYPDSPEKNVFVRLLNHAFNHNGQLKSEQKHAEWYEMFTSAMDMAAYAKGIAANDQQTIWKKEVIDHFFSLKPSIVEVNQLIQSLKRNGRLHQQIIVTALSHIQNIDDYRKLDKASPWRKYAWYTDAKKAFKASHSAWFPRNALLAKLF